MVRLYKTIFILQSLLIYALASTNKILKQEIRGIVEKNGFGMQ